MTGLPTNDKRYEDPINPINEETESEKESDDVIEDEIDDEFWGERIRYDDMVNDGNDSEAETIILNDAPDLPYDSDPDTDTDHLSDEEWPREP